jgi:hypothetical protein
LRRWYSTVLSKELVGGPEFSASVYASTLAAQLRRLEH